MKKIEEFENLISEQSSQINSFLSELINTFEKAYKLYDKDYSQRRVSFEESEYFYPIKNLLIDKSFEFKTELLIYIHSLSVIVFLGKNHFADYTNKLQQLWYEAFSLNDFESSILLDEQIQSTYEEEVKKIEKPDTYDTYLQIQRLSFSFQRIVSTISILPNLDDNLVRYIFEIVANVGHEARYYDCEIKSLLDIFKKHPMALSNMSNEQMKRFLNVLSKKEEIQLIQQLCSSENLIKISNNEAVGQEMLSFIYNSKADKMIWKDLIDFLSKDGAKTSPTKSWLNELSKNIEPVGRDEYLKFVKQTFNSFKTHLDDFHKEYKRESILYGNNENIIRGILFSIGFINDDDLNNLAFEITKLVYKKVPNVGALLPKTGGAALLGFSQLPFDKSIYYLNLAKSKIKYPSLAINAIEKQIIALANSSGKTTDDLEDISLKKYSFDNNGIITHIFDEYFAELSISNILKIKTTWFDIKRTILKSVPTKIKENYSDELMAFNKLCKEIQEMLVLQVNRIEGFYLNKRVWKYHDWKKIYLENHVMYSISKKLLWAFEKKGNVSVGIYHNNEWIDKSYNIITGLDDDTNITLWHPLYFDANFVLEWRNFIMQNELLQPFKQVFREIYVLTDAEINTNTYSNRFAGHILRNYQFGALLKVCNWKNYNQFHDGGVPTCYIKNWDITANFWVDFVNASNWGEYISTDQVCFYQKNEKIAMQNVPAIVFSETMRDIDLFVSVTSIGNDPTWHDNGDRSNYYNYWYEYSFGELIESAKIRKETIEKLLPRLKIKDKAFVKGRYLEVTGKLRNYKIHLGSGNILMQPNDQYLCIVPDRSEKSLNKIFLPFEGDTILSIILSKAFLLVEDYKITDETIMKQIIPKL